MWTFTTKRAIFGESLPASTANGTSRSPLRSSRGSPRSAPAHWASTPYGKPDIRNRWPWTRRYEHAWMGHGERSGDDEAPAAGGIPAARPPRRLLRERRNDGALSLRHERGVVARLGRGDSHFASGIRRPAGLFLRLRERGDRRSGPPARLRPLVCRHLRKNDAPPDDERPLDGRGAL